MLMSPAQHAFSLGDVPPLDADSYVPLYMQIAQQISTVIRARGELAVGKPVPSENQCVEHFGVSRPTVRQAMLQLMLDGLIVREKGRGTFVAPAKLSHEMSHGFEDEMKAANRKAEVRLLDWEEIDAPDDVREALDLKAGEVVSYLRRLRCVDGVPVGIEERYFPPHIGARITQAEARSQPMLSLLRKVTAKRNVRVDTEVSSVAASKEVARLLGAKAGAPLLIKRLTYLFEDQRVAYGTTTFLGDQYQFRFSINLPV